MPTSRPEPVGASMTWPSEVTRSAFCPVSPLPYRLARACAVAVARRNVLAAVADAFPPRRDMAMNIPDKAQRPVVAAYMYVVTTEVISSGTASSGPQVRATAQVRPDQEQRLAALWRYPEMFSLRRALWEEEERLLRHMLENAVHTAHANDTPVPSFTAKGGAWHTASVSLPSLPAPAPAVISCQRSTGEIHVNALSALSTPFAFLEAAAAMAARRPLDLAEGVDERNATVLEIGMALQDALQLSPDGWLVRAEALPFLTRAATLLPEQGWVWLMLAEAQLQRGLPQHCVTSCTEALRHMPSLARARYIRALAHWRMQQLALAEADLDVLLAQDALSGISEDRVRAVRLRTRGAVRQLRRDVVGMCQDYREACTLGDCEGMARAREQGFCQAALDDPPSTSSDSTATEDARP